MGLGTYEWVLVEVIVDEEDWEIVDATGGFFSFFGDSTSSTTRLPRARPRPSAGPSAAQQIHAQHAAVLRVSGCDLPIQ